MSNQSTFRVSKSAVIKPHLLALHLAKHPGLEQRIEHLHRAHIEACTKVGAAPDSFQVFALEIVNSPEEVQQEMLDPMPPLPYEPFQTYRQYQSPTAPEWKFSW